MSFEIKPVCRMPTGTNSPPPNGPEGSAPEAEATPSVADFRQGDEKKMLKKYVRSLNVYENKGTQDTMPEKKGAFMS